MKLINVYLRHFTLQLLLLLVLIALPHGLITYFVPKIPNTTLYFMIIIGFLRFYILTNKRYSQVKMKKRLQNLGIKSPSNKEISDHVRYYLFANNFNFIFIFLTIVITGIVTNTL